MRPQFRRTLAAAVCLIVVPISGALAGEPRHDLSGCPRRSPGSVELRKDDWVKINAPKVSSGDRTITSFAAAPGMAEHLYVTNGNVIQISRDGGCTWTTIYPLTTGGGPPIEVEPRPTLTHLAASPGRSLFAAGHQTYGAVTRPRVYLTGDATAPAPEFSAIDVGMPSVGRVVDLQVPVSHDMNTAYAVIEEPSAQVPGGVDKRLYTTYVEHEPEQAALLEVIWKNIELPDLGGPIEGFATSPLSRNIWVWSGSTYAVTTDVLAEDVAWDSYDVDGDIVAIDVNSSAVTTIVFRKEQATIAKIADATGKIIGELRVPLPVKAIAHGQRLGVYAVTDGKRTSGYDVRQRRWVDITPSRGPGVPSFDRLVMAPSSSGRVVIGATPDALYRWDTHFGETFLPPPSAREGGGPALTLPESNLTDVVLTPTQKVITVKPGLPVDQPVKLLVPPDANKIDVYFLLDTTSSMATPIARLRESIADIAEKLKKAVGKEACFGVGEFKDTTADAIAAGRVYKRHLPVTCEGTEVPLLKKALGGLVQSGGGDDPEAQTIALTQAVTGSGNRSLLIAEGQRADFRTDAFKVIVLMTDAWFKQGGQYPTMDSTVDALTREHIKVVGVQVSTNIPTPEKTRDDLDALSAATGTVAPEGGIDCDGDGKLGYGDLLPGDPLVCETDGDLTIARGIFGLLLGVQDFGSIAVHVDDPHDVVLDPVKGSTSALVNMKRDSGFTFTLPVMCTKEQDGLDLPIGLLPTVRAKTVLAKNKKDVLTGQILVQCRADVIEPPEPPIKIQPPEEVPPDPPARPRLPVAVALQPPPQPPAQPISNLNMNAGFSQQEEQQFQIATVTQGAEENEQQEEVELAMTGLDPHRNDLVAGAAALAGATLLSAAAAVAYRRRLQRSTRTAFAGAGSPRR